MKRIIVRRDFSEPKGKPSRSKFKDKRRKKALEQSKNKRPLTRLQKYAGKLNKRQPVSEKWFLNLYSNSGHYIECLQNQPFFYYIPDFINYKHKFIIEIDEDHHETTSQKHRDSNKDKFYISKGYRVYRVKAFNTDSYNEFLNRFKEEIEKASA